MNRMRLLKGPFSYRLIRGTFRPAPGRGGGGPADARRGFYGASNRDPGRAGCGNEHASLKRETRFAAGFPMPFTVYQR